MSKMDRIVVYIVGFGLGTLLVSYLMTRRATHAEAAVDPWQAHNIEMIQAGAEALPMAVPESMQNGRMMDFGYLPAESTAVERVWLVNFKASYPYVRIVEELAESELSYMAADQVVVQLHEGVDVTALKPVLDQLGLRLRMFNRKKQIAVVGVLHTGINAVPETIQAFAPWASLARSVEPDYIQFKASDDLP
jgi:hypothetical protein